MSQRKTLKERASSSLKFYAIILLIPIAVAFGYLCWGGGIPSTLVILAIGGFAGFNLVNSRHGLGVIAGVLFASALMIAPAHLTVREVECRIKGQESVTKGSGDSVTSEYRIYTDYGAESEGDKGETFKNTDSLPFFKVDSSDVNGQALDLTGKRVRMKVYSLRFPLLSIYSNVLSIELIE